MQLYRPFLSDSFTAKLVPFMTTSRFDCCHATLAGVANEQIARLHYHYYGPSFNGIQPMGAPFYANFGHPAVFNLPYRCRLCLFWGESWGWECWSFANKCVWISGFQGKNSVLFIEQVICSLAPEGRPGMSDVSPLSGISGLSFDSTWLSPLLFSA